MGVRLAQAWRDGPARHRPPQRRRSPSSTACCTLRTTPTAWPAGAYPRRGRPAGVAVVDAQASSTCIHGRRAADWFNLASFATSCRARRRRGRVPPRLCARSQARPRLVWPGADVHPAGGGSTSLSALKKNTELQPLSPFGWYRSHACTSTGRTRQGRRIIEHLKNSNRRSLPSWSARPDWRRESRSRHAEVRGRHRPGGDRGLRGVSSGTGAVPGR